ncbi:MAG: DM13 domain-containing protein [Chloroflexi bacterium]|nr:DM13 domain-containing protein [Chloroflexota bacterium]
MFRRKRVLIIAGAIALIPVLAIAGWLVAPLLVDKTVEEEFPFARNAVVPTNMTLDEVEGVMSGIAKVNSEMSEDMPDDMASEGAAVGLRTGQFSDADSFHRGSGTATVYEGPDGSRILRLEDFRVTNGPDLRVILSPHPNPQERDEVTAEGYIELGKLKGNIGNQNYEIPGGVDISDFGSVVIYCKAFHVLFSAAPLAEAA